MRIYANYGNKRYLNDIVVTPMKLKLMHTAVGMGESKMELIEVGPSSVSMQ